MKKIFKALSILAASTALCAGVAMATGCSGYNGKYEGEYSYVSWGHTYGMSVEVTVENNIITKVVDTTAVKHSDWVVVSNPPTPESPWNDEAKANWVNNEAWLLQKYEGLSVTEVIEKKVYIQGNGVPYEAAKNPDMSDVMITGATQGSGRLLLAVQRALGKKIEIGNILQPAKN